MTCGFSEPSVTLVTAAAMPDRSGTDPARTERKGFPGGARGTTVSPRGAARVAEA